MTTLIDRLREAAHNSHPGQSFAMVHLTDLDEAVHRLERLERYERHMEREKDPNRGEAA